MVWSKKKKVCYFFFSLFIVILRFHLILRSSTTPHSVHHCKTIKSAIKANIQCKNTIRVDVHRQKHVTMDKKRMVKKKKIVALISEKDRFFRNWLPFHITKLTHTQREEWNSALADEWTQFRVRKNVVDWRTHNRKISAEKKIFSNCV